MASKMKSYVNEYEYLYILILINIIIILLHKAC